MGGAAFRDKVVKRWAETPSRGAEARRLLSLAEAWSRPRLPVGGADVMALGVEAGPAVGRLIGELEAWWIGQDFVPGRAALLAELKARVGTA